MACMYIVHFAFTCDGKLGKRGRRLTKQLARAQLEIDLHLFRIILSRTAEPKFLLQVYKSKEGRDLREGKWKTWFGKLV
jgi:hypothetical protein